MTNLLAQAADYGPLVSQFGFGGALMWILVHRLDRYEDANARRAERNDHILRGLSRALWVDLASRPYSDRPTKDQAKKILAEMDAEKPTNGGSGI